MTARFITSALRGRSFAPVALALAVMIAPAAHATVIFTSDLAVGTTPSPDPNGLNYQLNYNGGTVTGIANTSPGGVLGYNFVFQDVAHAKGVGASNNGGGSATTLDTALMADSADTQDGGAFLALDSVYEVAAIDISIPTIAGDMYTVTFDWAGVQQQGYMGATSDALSVALNGGTAQTTSSVSVMNQGFSGWQTGVSDTFTASTTGTEILSFLASGTPTGLNQEPAMTLLDNIDVSQNSGPPPPMTPEPSSLLLLATGLLGLGGLVRYRFKKSEATNL